MNIRMQNEREYPLKDVTSISNTIMRTLGTGTIEYLVRVEIKGREFEGIVTNMRSVADAWRVKWEAELTRCLESDPDRDRKMSFAIMAKLEMPLRKKGVSEGETWDMFKDRYGVVLKREFGEKEWALIASTLDAAQKEVQLFNKLVQDVKVYVRKLHARNVEVTDRGKGQLRNLENIKAVEGNATPARKDTFRKTDYSAEEVQKLQQEWLENPLF